MKYVKVDWLQMSPAYPITLYSELNDGSFEARKVEVYADGRIDYADHDGRTGQTKLGIAPIPALEEIATDPQFRPTAISAEEFEAVWQKAISNHSE